MFFCRFTVEGSVHGLPILPIWPTGILHCSELGFKLLLMRCSRKCILRWLRRAKWESQLVCGHSYGISRKWVTKCFWSEFFAVKLLLQPWNSHYQIIILESKIVGNLAEQVLPWRAYLRILDSNADVRFRDLSNALKDYRIDESISRKAHTEKAFHLRV